MQVNTRRGNAKDTVEMLTIANTTVLLIAGLFSASALGRDTSAVNTAPAYTGDAQLKFPEQYREWVYLSSGFDMSYNPDAVPTSGHHTFDNVFVNPEAYRAFLKNGTWPDKTMLVLELRGGEEHGSINKAGSYQGKVSGVEVHVKDETRFPGKWAFFGFGTGETGKMIPQSAECYSCHANHAAVDTTFVQFYPTLLPIAKKLETLSPAYAKENQAEAHK